jgi:hypothetical protein
MNREGHENARFFYGTEVEHTPAHGRYTLFVVGVQNIDDIAAALTAGTEPVEHIYFGANMSFPKCGVNDLDIWRPWEQMIHAFLERDYLCTLDIDVSCVEGLHEGMFCEYNNFIPMISVKLPYINLFNYNATLKIDDRDFRATNAGVWCHSIHDLQNRAVFTDWSKYTKDEVKNG